MAYTGVQTLNTELGSPRENGYSESFTDKLRDESPNAVILHTLEEARVMIERWRQNQNTVKPHRALGYRPPAPEALLPPIKAASLPMWALLTS
ncbi:MAG: transposase [Proteobacteria bacterium]|nr:transposase [Pseudomonadota bacterium]